MQGGNFHFRNILNGKKKKKAIAFPYYILFVIFPLILIYKKRAAAQRFTLNIQIVHFSETVKRTLRILQTYKYREIQSFSQLFYATLDHRLIFEKTI